MTIPALSEATIRAHSAAESYSRGQSYYEHGAVSNLALRGNLLQADVEGSQYTPYRVRVTFDQGGITSATCTCPYDWGGWCKHIVAVMLACLYQGNRIETRPDLATLLADLDRAQLQALVLGLAERDSELADAIEREVALLRLASATPQAREAGGQPRRSPIDQAAIRRQVQIAMQPPRRGRYDDYDYDDYDDEDPGGEVVEAVRPLLDQAREFLVGGDARSALAIMEAITTEYLAGCSALSDRLEEMYGLGIAEVGPGEFFDELAEVWAEAILSADLSEDERDDWGEQIAGWRDEADDLGVGASFDIALAAAEQGWDYPPLVRALAGEITDLGAWEGARPDYADELALVRLRVIERQERYQEYVYLAEAEGQTERYVLMLARMGRTEEAVAEGLKYLTMPNDVLALAKALREQGDVDGAWRIAEHGLALKPPRAVEGYGVYYGDRQKADPAAWAADLAAGLGQRDRALRAAEAAFRAVPSLAAYLKAQELAGEQWEQTRSGLLEELRRSLSADAKVDVFLHEGLIDEAIAAVKDVYSYGLLERVMDAAIATRPDWVIKAASAQAERIMDAGDAQHYHHAVDWLRRARDAFRAAGRPADWQGYLSSIRTKHGRKYKLMGLIEGL
jgi:uncharacterized Zn finger protein